MESRELLILYNRGNYYGYFHLEDFIKSESCPYGPLSIHVENGRWWMKNDKSGKITRSRKLGHPLPGRHPDVALAVMSTYDKNEIVRSRIRIENWRKRLKENCHVRHLLKNTRGGFFILPLIQLLQIEWKEV